jgi:hypothetical protein
MQYISAEHVYVLAPGANAAQVLKAVEEHYARIQEGSLPATTPYILDPTKLWKTTNAGLAR